MEPMSRMTRVEALGLKAKAFGELLEISRGQDAVLSQDDPEALMALLSRKQGLLQRIEGLDRELASPADGTDGAEEPQAREFQARILETLGLIVACEEETRKQVESMKRQTLQDLSRIRQGRRAADLYRRTSLDTAAVDREQ